MLGLWIFGGLAGAALGIYYGSWYLLWWFDERDTKSVAKLAARQALDAGHDPTETLQLRVEVDTGHANMQFLQITITPGHEMEVRGAVHGTFSVKRWTWPDRWLLRPFLTREKAEQKARDKESREERRQHIQAVKASLGPVTATPDLETLGELSLDRTSGNLSTPPKPEPPPKPSPTPFRVVPEGRLTTIE